MADKDYRSINDPDWWAGNFLLCCCLWDASEGRRVEGADELNPELAQHLHREAWLAGDYTLRFWRGEFYRWERGRYIRISDSDVRCWLKPFVHANNYANYGCRVEDGSYVQISRGLLDNIMLSLAGFERVHLAETTELNAWKDGVSRGAVVAFENGLLLMP